MTRATGKRGLAGWEKLALVILLAIAIAVTVLAWTAPDPLPPAPSF